MNRKRENLYLFLIFVLYTFIYICSLWHAAWWAYIVNLLMLLAAVYAARYVLRLAGRMQDTQEKDEVEALISLPEEEAVPVVETAPEDVAVEAPVETPEPEPSVEDDKEEKEMSHDEQLMQRIMEVINANLDDPNLGNELITKEVGISRVHLYRKLKELTNSSLRDFIRNIRLEEAARLLREQDYSISEVVKRTGFENVSYFTVVFKQKFGMPPSRYYEQQKKA